MYLDDVELRLENRFSAASLSSLERMGPRTATTIAYWSDLGIAELIYKCFTCLWISELMHFKLHRGLTASGCHESGGLGTQVAGSDFRRL